jgi:hypothetical protein
VLTRKFITTDFSVHFIASASAYQSRRPSPSFGYPEFSGYLEAVFPLVSFELFHFIRYIFIDNTRSNAPGLSQPFQYRHKA